MEVFNNLDWLFDSPLLNTHILCFKLIKPDKHFTCLHSIRTKIRFKKKLDVLVSRTNKTFKAHTNKIYVLL